MSNVIQPKYLSPITITKKILNIDNTTQKPKEINISFMIPKDDFPGFFNISEREGMIRKPGPAEPNALENFKPKIFELVPELQQLTDKEFEKLLENDDDEE